LQTRKPWRILKKFCSLVLVVTVTLCTMPAQVFAAGSNNYRLASFVVNSGGEPQASANFAVNTNILGEPVLGASQSANISSRTGFLSAAEEGASIASPPPEGTDRIAESANFRQTALFFGASGGSMSSANFALPFACSGEVINGIFSANTENSLSGHIYTILNNPPILAQNIPVQSWPMYASSNNAFDLDDYFSDPDGDTLTFIVSGNTNITATIDPVTHEISFTHNAGFIGNEDIIITAIDLEGNRTPSHPVTLNVYQKADAPVDNTPVLNFISDITAREGELIGIQPSALDPNGDTITYSYSAPFNAQGEWQTDYQAAGNYTITVTASDGSLTDTQDINVIILNVNRKPTLNNIPDILGYENQLITIMPTAADPDGDALTYTYDSPFNSSGQWIPGYNGAGIRFINVTVSDGEFSDSQTVLVNVINVNTVPTVSIAFDSINAKVDENFSFIVDAADADGDPLTLTLEKDGTQFYSGSVYGFYVGTASFSTLGTHTIKAIVDDSHGGQAQTTANIEIINPPDLWNKILPLLGDFNADGLVDVGTYNRDTGRWSVAISNFSGFGSITEWLTNFGTSTDWQYVNGDFNADGKTDIAIFNQTNGEWQVGTSDGTKFNNQGTWSTFSGASSDSVPITGDFNGDGVSDVGAFNKSNGNITIATSNKNGFNAAGSWLTGFAVSSGAKPFSGDFNADGLIDIGVFNDGAWSFAVSDGSQFIIKSAWNMSFGAGLTPIISDFNNDGLTDIGTFDKNAGSWQIYHCTGDGFMSKGAWIASFGQGEYNTPYALDYNGDGMTDAAIFNNSTFRWQRTAASGTVADLMRKITNSLGGTTEITYKSSVYYDNTGNDDECDLPFAIQTVSTVKQGDGLGNFYQTKYSYAGGLYAASQRETRGFGYVKVTDADGNTSETWFKQDDIFKQLPYKSEIKDSFGTLFAKTVKTYDYATPYTGSTFAFLVSEEAFNYEGQITPLATKAAYEYDSYGNPTKVTNLGNVDIAGDEKEADTQYVYNTSSWILGLASYASLKDAQGQIVRQKWFYYDNNVNYTDIPTKGELTKEESWLDTPGAANPAVQYNYDNYGNLTIATDARLKTTTTAYDALTHSCPETATNHIGHSIQNTYDYKTGQVLTSTDANNQTSRSEYDAFGRISKVFGPNDDALHPQTWYEYDLTTLPAKVTTYIREEANTDDPAKIRVSYAFIDGLGRTIEVKTEADDPSRQIISGIVKFNNKGQVEHEYLPCLVPKSASYTTPDLIQPKTTYEYDTLGRVIKSIAPDLTYSSVEYLPGEVTTTDANGHQTKKYHDAYGQTVKIEEFNHGRIYTTTYGYDTQGNLLQTIDDHGNSINIIYDSLGRKTAMDDPDMGQWSYEYDANGNMIRQTDARGQALNFEYDDINRLTKKCIINGPQTIDLANYVYDDLIKANCTGRLSKVVDQSGSTEFFYDNLGREIRSEKTIDGITYSVQRVYDAMDRLKSLAYPDGEVVNYTYSISGGIKTVTGAQTYVSDVSYTETGQMSHVDYGNNTYADYQYDPLTLRLSRLTTNGGALQDFQYQFDNVGNIRAITDGVYTATQSFSYDDLNRLVSAAGQSYGTKTYKYDSIGNILEKDGVAYNYGENGAGPHAVTSGNNGTVISYDENGNMLAKDSKAFEYDSQNRLAKVTAPAAQPQSGSFGISLKPGWNFVSLPLVPQDTQISSVLNSIEFGQDYDQLSRYNPQTGDFDNYNNTSYNQFDTLEYGKGYLLYVTNLGDITLDVSGEYPSSAIAYPLMNGWNLIGTPSSNLIAVSDALSNLVLNTDYDRVTEYSSGSYIDLAQDDLLQPGKAYFIHCLRDVTWDIAPQPRTEITTFACDGDGGRVKKSTATSTITYVGSLYEVESGGSTRKHIFLGSNRVCTVNSKLSTVSYNYYHSDHLGSSSVITDGGGQLVQHLEYLPFGQTQVNTGTDVTNYKFTGKELDASTGLYYYSARYYDAELGRFTQADSAAQNPYDPQTLNRYAYCRNNPVVYIDPSGHFFGAIFAVIFAIVKAATVGAAVGAAGAAITGGDVGRGAAMGAVSGAFTGGLGFLGAPGIIAGAIGGATTAGIFGGNIGLGALCGGIGGGIGEYLGNWASGWNSGSFWGGLGAAAVTSGIAGGAGAELSGGKFGRGFGVGAAYGAGGYLGTNVANNLNPRYRKSRIYEEKMKEIRALSLKKGDMVTKTIGSRDVGKGPFKHKFIDGYEMGPEYPGGPIATTDTIQDLGNWKTHLTTQSSLGNGTAITTTVGVSASGLSAAQSLYNSTWAGGDTYVGTSYNSNYAVNTVVYGAGGNVPGGLGLAPAFGNISYIPSAYAEN